MKSQVKKILLISIALIVLGLMMGGASFYFLYVEGLQAAQAKLDQVNEQVRVAEQKNKDIAKLRAQLTEAEMRAQQVKLMIPDLSKEEFDGFIKHLARLATDTGVKMLEPRQVTPRAPSRGSAITVIPPEIERVIYEVKFNGDFLKLVEFLGVLETAIRYVRIDSLAFNKGKTTGLDGKEVETTVLTLTINAFAYKLPGAPPGAPKQPTMPPTVSRDKEQQQGTTLPPR